MRNTERGALFSDYLVKTQACREAKKFRLRGKSSKFYVYISTHEFICASIRHVN